LAAWRREVLTARFRFGLVVEAQRGLYKMQGNLIEMVEGEQWPNGDRIHGCQREAAWKREERIVEDVQPMDRPPRAMAARLRMIP